MDSAYLDAAARAMRERGIVFSDGLTDHEIEVAEATHGFRFPPDLRRYLQHAMPVGERFPDWRIPKSEVIFDSLAWPSESICFDIENNGFWLPEWGLRPEAPTDALALGRQALQDVPILIPVYSHRFLPADPSEAGNPVFSVYQTDIIYYGYDLASYLFAEFNVPNPFPIPQAPREIGFWSELERLNS
jgi:hypothetical protein